MRGKNQSRRISIANRDYHYLSHFEIGGAKRIYKQQSVLLDKATRGGCIIALNYGAASLLMESALRFLQNHDKSSRTAATASTSKR